MKKILFILYILVIKQTILSQAWLPNLVPKTSLFQEMINIVDALGPIDTTYWNCYCLDFYKFSEDTLCMAYKVNREDMWFSPQNDYIGYIKTNDSRILVHGKEALPYIETDTVRDCLLLQPNKTQSFIEWVGIWPNFLIRNGVSYQIIEINEEYKIYKMALDRVLKDFQLSYDAISLEFEQGNNKLAFFDTMQIIRSSYNMITRNEMYPQSKLDINLLYVKQSIQNSTPMGSVVIRPIRQGVFSIFLKRPSSVVHYLFNVSPLMKPTFVSREILKDLD